LHFPSPKRSITSIKRVTRLPVRFRNQIASECLQLADRGGSRLPNATIQSQISQADPIFVAKNACGSSGAQIG
jgi:hypothetical protein